MAYFLRNRLVLLLVLIVTSRDVACVARTNDYCQWRGPLRNGVAEGGQIDGSVWSKNELPLLWNNGEIPGNGYSSVSVCKGRAYVFCVAQYSVPLAERTLSEDGLKRLGWFDETFPTDLFRRMEEDRVGEARSALKGKELNEWIESWIDRYIADEEQRKRLGRIVSDRLRRGRDALPLKVLKKLETVKDKSFASQDELDKWFAKNDIEDEMRKAILRVIPTSEKKANDVIFCLDAATGEILWRSVHPVDNKGSDASSTVRVADNRCYVAGSNGDVYCLNADTGDKVWKTRATQGIDTVHSSPLCAGGVVSVLADHLVGIRATDGEILWRQENVRGRENSPVSWRSGDGQVYVICNTSRDVGCVRIQTGELVWTVPGGGRSTVAISENNMVVLSSRDEVGLAAYDLSAEPPEKLWSCAQYTDGAASPVIYKDRVLAVGGERALCVDLSTGEVMLDAEVGGKGHSSPAVCDGTLVAVVGKDVLAVDAKADAYNMLAKWQLSCLQYTSPAIADGKLFLRKKDGLYCYSLR